MILVIVQVVDIQYSLENVEKKIFPLCPESNFEEQKILGFPLNIAFEALAKRKYWDQCDRSNDSSPFQGTVALLFFEEI